MALNEVEKQVLKRITPTKEYREQLEKIINEINEKIEQGIKKRKLPVKTILVGSTAKDTFLKHNMDIDFFLLFPTSYEKEKIAKNAISIGETFLENTEESYAEHPYLRGYYKEHKVEIVPCYKIEDISQKLSAVDRTPLHTKYVKENLKKSQKQEVRLFKQFLQGTGCYGAEAEIEGFSGYLCEILIIKYGCFSELIKNAQNWKTGGKLSIIDGKYKSFDTPLTFIDPVDGNRNVSSALSKEKFDLFIKACKEYIKNPKTTFFFPNPIKPWALEKIRKEIQKQKCQYVGIRISKPDILDENLYPQIRKATRSIWESCERCDFTIFDVMFHIDNIGKNIFIIVKTKDKNLSKTQIHMGPPVKLKKNADEFLKKWNEDARVITDPYEKNDRFYVEIEREYIEITGFLNDQIKNFSLGKHLDQNVRKNYEIVELNNLLDDNLKVFWTTYLDGKMSWER